MLARRSLRVVAAIVDCLVVWTPFFVLVIVIGASRSKPLSNLHIELACAAWWVLTRAYYVLCNGGRRGQTLGKSVVRNRRSRSTDPRTDWLRDRSWSLLHRSAPRRPPAPDVPVSSLAPVRQSRRPLLDSLAVAGSVSRDDRHPHRVSQSKGAMLARRFSARAWVARGITGVRSIPTLRRLSVPDRARRSRRVRRTWSGAARAPSLGRVLKGTGCSNPRSARSALRLSMADDGSRLPVRPGATGSSTNKPERRAWTTADKGRENTFRQAMMPAPELESVVFSTKQSFVASAYSSRSK